MDAGVIFYLVLLAIIVAVLFISKLIINTVGISAEKRKARKDEREGKFEKSESQNLADRFK